MEMFSIEKINQQTEIVHRAIQIMVKASKSWLPEKADDSHTNLHWNIEKNSFETRSFPLNIKLVLNLNSSGFEIHQNEKVNRAIPLSGKNHEELERDVKNSLVALGLTNQAWNPQLHYELPYPLLAEFSYPEMADGFFKDFIQIRNFGQGLFETFESKENLDLGLRTWPHHFDLGGQIILSKDENNEATSSLGLGLAMQDSIVEEYYFYLSFWTKKENKKAEKLPVLKFGGWDKEMGLFILRISDLKASKNDYNEMVIQFLSETIGYFKKHS